MFKIHPGLGFWMWCYSHSLSAGASLLWYFLSGLNLFLTCVPAMAFFVLLLLLHSILYFIIVLVPRWFINVTVIFMASAIEFSCGVWEIGGHRILWCLWFINCLFLGRPLLSRMNDSALLILGFKCPNSPASQVSRRPCSLLSTSNRHLFSWKCFMHLDNRRYDSRHQVSVGCWK